ncbi:MAG: hypothetical protein KDA41_00625, partial [Planctomycetales bacterium]|nr:hypothetical protein [Planctomycetales bacterium]
LGEEMDAADVVVIAEMTVAPAAPSSSDSNELQKSVFKIVDVIKGKVHLKDSAQVELLYFGEGKLGGRFLMMAVDPPKLAWVTPTLLNETTERYVKSILSLPAEGPKRLKFFQDYLEHADDLLARDAYDEFARAPYDDVCGLKESMNHQQIRAWVKNTYIPAGRRRLYLTMLGVCGDKGDADMLEGMLRSDDRQVKSGLDALIACYLTLRKADGLPLVEDLFLKNEKCEYAETYSAIMALRFHGQEGGAIPRERVVKSLHHMLDRPKLADLVIVDLARWEDWSVMDRLVQLFKNADEESSWVRVPVVRYLLACPKPEAKTYLEELEKVDAGAVKRAKTFFPFDSSGAAGAATSQAPPPAKDAAIIAAKPTAAVPVVPVAFAAKKPALPPTSAAISTPRANSWQAIAVVTALAALCAAVVGVLCFGSSDVQKAG